MLILYTVCARIFSLHFTNVISLIFKTNFFSRYYYYPYFIKEEAGLLTSNLTIATELLIYLKNIFHPR